MEILLNLYNRADLNFLEKIEKKIPDLKLLKIESYGSGGIKNKNSFFKNYFPDKVGSFYFNDGSCLTSVEEELMEN